MWVKPHRMAISGRLLRVHDETSRELCRLGHSAGTVGERRRQLLKGPSRNTGRPRNISEPDGQITDALMEFALRFEATLCAEIPSLLVHHHSTQHSAAPTRSVRKTASQNGRKRNTPQI
jgi:hypothetical protein